MAKFWLKRTIIAAAAAMFVGVSATAPAAAATDPVIVWSDSITDGASYPFGQVPAAPTCTVEADPAAVCVVTGYDTTTGDHTLTATASSGDLVVSDTISYSVTPWTLKGFYAPVRIGDGVWNKAKAGSTVPLKFKIYRGDTRIRELSAVTGATMQAIDCTSATPLADASPLIARLKYDDGRFRLNWKTPKPARVAESRWDDSSDDDSRDDDSKDDDSNDDDSRERPQRHSKSKSLKRSVPACYTVAVTTADGSSLSANFILK